MLQGWHDQLAILRSACALSIRFRRERAQPLLEGAGVVSPAPAAFGYGCSGPAMETAYAQLTAVASAIRTPQGLAYRLAVWLRSERAAAAEQLGRAQGDRIGGRLRRFVIMARPTGCVTLFLGDPCLDF
jgi:hypothetical protein